MKLSYIFISLIFFIHFEGVSQNRELLYVLVGNEGNFNSGNATITQYDFKSGTATDGVFFAANGTGIGDVVQSLSWVNNEIFAVINNSQKIVIMNPETFEQTAQINFPEGASIRELLRISDTKAYVTDLYANLVYILDLGSKQIMDKTIPAGLNPDYMVKHEEHVYVANHGFGNDSTIFKIDISTDSVIDTFVVNRGPSAMVVDSQSVLWVVSTGYAGDYDESWNLIPGTNKPGGIHGIDLTTGEEIAFTEIESANPDLAVDTEEDKLYFISGGVRVYDTGSRTLENEAVLEGNFYALGYEPVNRLLFISDAKDFSSKGDVHIYNVQEEETSTFQAGIIPGSYLFVYNEMTDTHTESVQEINGFELLQNYPNPFNPVTEIPFVLKEPGYIKLEVFNATGQKIATLWDGYQSAGMYSMEFNAASLSSGIYFYRLSTSAGNYMNKMTLIK